MAAAPAPRLKILLRVLLISIAAQLVLLLIVCPLVSRNVAYGSLLPHFLVQYVYDPFIRWVIDFGGYEGESSMIWPPVYGVVLGIIIYSVMAGLLAELVSYVRRQRKQKV
ncbi:MAG TPA: hypothetical protein VLL54_00875 [Pyrinomonadaceae bacterium]|nr:hypothetical protein [Pyrinomonadaceae bacterium]